MSEPPLKKKRTILDFFAGEGKKVCPESRETRSKAKTMATALATSPVKVQNEVPGTSKTDATSETIDLTDSQDQAESGGSQEMEDSQESACSQDIPTRKPSQRADGSTKWKGTPIKVLSTIAECEGDLGPLQHIEHPRGNAMPHKVLFKLPFTYDGKSPPKPFPHFKDKWDGDHVRMPCSNSNEYPCTEKNKTVVRRRWELIQEALLADIPGPYELEETILQYNTRYFGKWNFDILHKFFIEVCENEERDHFFNNIVKKMATLALQLPDLCTAPIPLLKAGKNQSITLSQQQVACLLANAFFCTFPRRNAKSKNSEYYKYPSINFNSLYVGQPSSVKFEKLRCIINYFKRVCTKMPTGNVTFTRQCVDKLPDWDNDSTFLSALHVSAEGTIEDDGDGFLQVDFANMFLGGGVLGHGCVQEEIRFLICPEMILSRLFTESLEKNECLIMRGCERFSNYDGYASSFRWTANYDDKTPRDSWGRIQCEVVAIDALVVRDYRQQFQAWHVKRELNKWRNKLNALKCASIRERVKQASVSDTENKAVCGFVTKGAKSKLPAVCTGNWGCGAFGGDKHLKALIQIMAAARAKRDVCYFTFDDERLCHEFHAIHQYLTVTNMLCIADIMKLIDQYRRNKVVKSRGKPSMKLFEYIKSVFNGSLEDTDEEEDINESLEMQHWADSDEIDNNMLHEAEPDDVNEKESEGKANTEAGKSKNKNAYPGKAANSSGDVEMKIEDADEKSKLKHNESLDYKANTP